MVFVDNTPKSVPKVSIVVVKGYRRWSCINSGSIVVVEKRIYFYSADFNKQTSKLEVLVKAIR